MKARLTKEQAERLRTYVVRTLMPRHKTYKAIAEQAGLNDQVFRRFMRGEVGTTIQVAQTIADAGGTEVTEILGIKIGKKTVSLALTPGYAMAEYDAMEFYSGIPSATWDFVRRLEMPKRPKSITAAQLGALAKAVNDLDF